MGVNAQLCIDLPPYHRGNAQLVSYTIHASYIPNANYIQYKIDESITSPGTFVETELRGIRVAVRQSGGCGFVPCGCGCVCEPANQMCSCSF
jgi:hypothetical protein